MTAQQMAEKANKQLFARYAKKLAELNKNIFPAPRNNAGELEVPTIEIGPGGGCLIDPTDPEDKKLPPPALLEVKIRAQKPTTALYRILIPMSELEVALNQPSYFNYFFDKVLTIALNRYAYTFGSPEECRFGEYYVSFGDGLSPAVNEKTGEDGFILVLKGSWVK